MCVTLTEFKYFKRCATTMKPNMRGNWVDVIHSTSFQSTQTLQLVLKIRYFNNKNPGLLKDLKIMNLCKVCTTFLQLATFV